MATVQLNLRHSSWDLIWSSAHRILMINAAVVLVNLPLLAALAIVDRPWRYPAFFLVLALTLGPSAAGAFAYLDDADDGVRQLARTYRRHFRRSVLLWSLSLAMIAVLAGDIAVLRTSPAGAVVVPALAVGALLVLLSATTAQADLVRRPGVPLRVVLWSAVYLSVRRWWITVANVVLLAVAALIVNQAPVLGLATVPGCVLFVVWNNNRAVFRST
jgi:hypothetical protein